MCDLEKEVKLLREKVELLEKVRDLETNHLSIPNWEEPNYTGTPLPFKQTWSC